MEADSFMCLRRNNPKTFVGPIIDGGRYSISDSSTQPLYVLIFLSLTDGECLASSHLTHLLVLILMS